MKLGMFLVLLACCLHLTTARPNDIEFDDSQEKSQPTTAENSENEELHDGYSQSESEFDIDDDSDDDWLVDVKIPERSENDAMDRIDSSRELAELLYSDYSVDRSKFIESFEQQDSFEITMLNKSTNMYKQICDYVNNTQLRSVTTKYYYYSGSYEVDEIFKVYRHEEVERYEPFEKNYNRQLLVHSASVKNIVDILKNGLKVSPPEAIFKGSIFGKGIYFTDSVSKSAAYSRSNNGYPLVMLCEVALGMIDIRYKTDISKLKDHCESMQALGDYYPQSIHIQPDGLKISNGMLLKRNETTGIPFNEFVVSDEARAKIRYIVKLKPKY